MADAGTGLSAEKLWGLEETLHYMEGTEERLDLRHGLGLLLVRQVMEAHEGTMRIESAPRNGCTAVPPLQRLFSSEKEGPPLRRNDRRRFPRQRLD